MKVLVIIEHDNETVKQSSFSTITAAKEISDSVEASSWSRFGFSDQ